MSTPTHSGPRARFRYAVSGAVVIGLAGLLGLSACSSGQITQTSHKVSAIPGVNTSVGDIAIRDALVSSSPEITWPAGSDIAVSLTLVNEGTVADALIGATSTSSSEVKLAKGKLPLTELPGATPTPSATPTPTATPSASPSATPGVTPSPSPSPSEPVTEPQEFSDVNVPLAPEGRVKLNGLGEDPQYLVLVDAKNALTPGNTVTVTLRFERAGEITLTLPVGPPAEPREREPLKHEEEAEH
ncbi:MAG: hypothetical protein HOQ05_06645 [Corynebacteriales bacterium]|nr:hypothetical protein [Mycobacteriales bacterium]